MGIDLGPHFWVALGEIILVNILLSGDNALVIALACRNLEPRHQRPAILAGSAGAIILRIVFCIFIVQLLEIPYLKLVGGLLLLWIGVKLVAQDEEEAGGHVKASASLWGAIQTIVVADAVMSLDNAIAIAAAAKGDILLLGIGLVISIPLIIFGSTLIMAIIGRFPILVVLGGALLGWIAGDVIETDPALTDWIEARIPHAHLAFEIGGAVLVVAIGSFLARRAKAGRHDAVDLAAGSDKK